MSIIISVFKFQRVHGSGFLEQKTILRSLKNEATGTEGEERCNLCEAEMTSKESLEAHEKLHSAQVRCCLPSCDFTCRGIDDLKSHVDEAHKAANCAEHFEKLLEKRDGEDSKPTKYACLSCGYYSVSRVVAEVHVTREHLPEETPLRCCLCESRFGHVALLFGHLKTRHLLFAPLSAPLPPAAIDTCVLARSTHTLKLIAKRSLPPGRRLFTKRKKVVERDALAATGHGGSDVLCEQCGYTAADGLDMANHRAAMHGSYKCDKCDFATGKRREMLYHKRYSHTERCPACRFPLFTRNWKLGDPYPEHECPARLGPGSVQPEVAALIEAKGKQFLMARIKRLTTGNFVCTECGLVGKGKVNMERHCKLMHSNWQCELCAFRTMTRESLLKHVKYSHTLKCGGCGVVSKTEEEASRHACRQEDVLAFQRESATAASMTKLDPGLANWASECEICGFVSPSRENLKRHVERKHSGAVHECAECGKRLGDVYSLRQHRRQGFRVISYKHRWAKGGERGDLLPRGSKNVPDPGKIAYVVLPPTLKKFSAKFCRICQ